MPLIGRHFLINRRYSEENPDPLPLQLVKWWRKGGREEGLTDSARFVLQNVSERNNEPSSV